MQRLRRAVGRRGERMNDQCPLLAQSGHFASEFQCLGSKAEIGQPSLHRPNEIQHDFERRFKQLKDETNAEIQAMRTALAPVCD